MSQLVRKGYKNYDSVSRYSVYPYYYNKLDDKYIYGLTSQLKKENTPFVNHIVKDDDTLDTLSLYYYNNPTYFWIIADFNNIQDPYKKLKVGTTLQIPTFSSIKFDV